jgi:hypothetical protein
MRLGCGGCLSTIATLVVLGGILLVGGWLVGGLLDVPAGVGSGPVGRPADADRAEQKVARGAPVVLTEAEVDALVGRYLARDAGLPVIGSRARLPGDGAAVVHVSASLRSLLTSERGSWIDWVPRWITDRPVWLSLHLHPAVESRDRQRAHVRLQIRELRIGSRRLPVQVLGLLLDPSALTALRWPLPPGFDLVQVERGKIVLSRGSSPSRTEPATRR